MKLQTMLGKIDAPKANNEKTAGARQRTSTSSVDAEIEKAMNAIGAEKTASAQSAGGQEVVPGLLKIAQELQQAEKTASAAEAVEHGRLMARGFIDEMAQYTKAASDLSRGQEQQTQYDANEIAILSKFAQENPAEYRAALQRGYNDQMTLQEKQANEKFAAEQALLEKFAAEDQEGFEACVKRGFDETAQELMKTAQAEFNEGYVSTILEHRKEAALHFAMSFDAMNQAADAHIRATRRQQRA